MKNTVIYISGKITGDDDFRGKFLRASNKLFDAGYRTINPVLLVPQYVDWQSAMRTVLSAMLISDGVALLPDWTESRGAKIEERLAREIGLAVKPIEEWLHEKN